MTVIFSLLALLVAFLVVTTMAAIAFPRAPLLGVAQHWGLQLWQLALLAIAIALALSNWWIVAVSVLVAAFWTSRLFPRWRKEPARAEGATLRILAANLLLSNSDYARILAMIDASDADIVVLCEVTMEARAALTGMRARYLHALDTCAPGSPYGLLILSRLPLKERSRGVGEDPAPRHLAADLEILGGGALALIALHPTNPLRLDRRRRIPGEFDAIARLCNAAPENLILIGDCNAAGWSRYARDLEQSARLSNDGRIRPSWPVWLPMPLRLPLDHVWVRGNLILQQAMLGSAFGSDHLPLIADIGWRDR